jgi:hypothetical protein
MMEIESESCQCERELPAANECEDLASEKLSGKRRGYGKIFWNTNLDEMHVGLDVCRDFSGGDVLAWRYRVVRLF